MDSHDKFPLDYIYHNPKESIQCACAATDFRSIEIFSVVDSSGRNFLKLVFTKFGIILTPEVEVISKAEFVCDPKRKYLPCFCAKYSSL